MNDSVDMNNRMSKTVQSPNLWSQSNREIIKYFPLLSEISYGKRKQLIEWMYIIDCT